MDSFLLQYPPADLPLSVLICEQFLKGKLNFKVAPSKDVTQTTLTILSNGDQHDFTFSCSLEVGVRVVWGPSRRYEIDQWVDASLAEEIFVASNPSQAQASFASFCDRVNWTLQFRTVLVGYQISIADLAVWSCLKKHPKWDEATQKKFPHVTRWALFLASRPEVVPLLSQHFAPKTNRMGAQGSWTKVELEGAKEGEVVTRFPPEPSGFLHLGHAKAALLNQFYATHYKGRLVIRFDDTNAQKEKDEYVQAILKDLKTLGIDAPKITYTTDYLDRLQEIAEQFIKNGHAYVDNRPQEQISADRAAGNPSPFRDASPEENLKKWNEMKAGTPEGLNCVLRAKIDYAHKNKALRDPNIYRCSVVPHHRVGTKYRVFPLYDFAIPLVDSIEGVTHALRSSEYHDRNPLYYWIVDTAGLRRPCIQDFSRLNFAYTLLSKRKLQYFVDKGLVDGWDDPRFPTVQGLVRRGLTVEALKEYVIAQGASKSITLQEMDKLWAVNKKILDPIVPRYTAIAASSKVVFHLSGVEGQTHQSVPRHKKNPSLGNKVITYGPAILLERADADLIRKGEEVTLMDWGNAIVEEVEGSGENLTLKGRLHLEGSVKSTEKKLTWLAVSDDNLSVTLRFFDKLITKKKLEENDKLEDWINPNTRVEIPALGDPNLRLLAKGDKLQLERRGYFICDEPYVTPSKPVVLINIPDGHSKSVFLSDSPKEAEAKK